jgi:hypothetical protein
MDEHLELTSKPSFCRHVTRLTSEYTFKSLRHEVGCIGSWIASPIQTVAKTFLIPSSPIVVSGFICFQHMRKRREACPWPVDETVSVVAEYEHRKGNSYNTVYARGRNIWRSRNMSFPRTPMCPLYLGLLLFLKSPV